MNKKTSENGIELIKEFEGYRSEAYQCTSGIWTIGYGHTKNVQKNDTCNVEEAAEFLKQDVEIAERAINQLVKVELNQNQFDALVSFVFNIGVGSKARKKGFAGSTMLAFINAGHFPLAAGQFDRWVYSRSNKSQGLINRRAKEKELFLKTIE